MICLNCKGSGEIESFMLGKTIKCSECKGKGYIGNTNFDRITESLETLASWLDEHVEFCDEISCSECFANEMRCKGGTETGLSNAKLWLAWLKRESDTE